MEPSEIVGWISYIEDKANALMVEKNSDKEMQGISDFFAKNQKNLAFQGQYASKLLSL